MDIKKFFDFYQENGFFFSDEILTRYCLSLHTKPFVILSGISGTGKTKIAQLFQPIINKFLIDIFSQSQTVNDDDVVINITKNMIDGGGRGNIKYGYREYFYNEQELEEIDRRIETLKKEGKEDNITKPKKIILVTEDDEKIPIQIYLQRASNPLLRIRLKSKNTDKDTFDSRSYFRTNYSVNSKLLLKKVEENTFKILSQSESTNKYFLQISNELESKKLNNQCFVSVRSDWVDATDVFGYYDSFSGKYHITKILKFIFEANENSDIPYFLIFDEMNLSKVEYYFSDVLSVMESKYLNDKGESVQEPVTLHSNPVEADDSLIEEVEKIYIPDNLYITGTVNIDETTYMFSPKVLDRANVLEFNEVDIDGYENNYSQSEEKKSDFVLNEMPVFGKAIPCSRNDFIETDSLVKEKLKEIVSLLKKNNLHFGYRVINEISKYINNTIKYVDGEEKTIVIALDQQILQKILTKLNGTYNKLEAPLKELIYYLSDKTTDFEDISIDNIEEVTTMDFHLSIAKLKRMYKNVFANGFTNYIE